jgi:ACS family allantoate permease-like MFS transporter
MAIATKSESDLQHIEHTVVEDDDDRSLEKVDGVHAPAIKSAAEKRYIKKLNWTLLPFVWMIVFIQFADKSSISLSAVLGMLTDTNTSQSQYSLLGSVFYIGFILFQIPNNYLIQRFPIRIYLGTLLILWGISVGCTALCQNFTQLVVCRVLLGVFEAGTYPCLYIILNSLYRQVN